MTKTNQKLKKYATEIADIADALLAEADKRGKKLSAEAAYKFATMLYCSGKKPPFRREPTIVPAL